MFFVQNLIFYVQINILPRLQKLKDDFNVEDDLNIEDKTEWWEKDTITYA